MATARNIPVGTAYAVWTGIGATGTAVLGMILFKDPADVYRIVCLVLIIAGAMGLKFQPAPSEVSKQAVGDRLVPRDRPIRHLHVSVD